MRRLLFIIILLCLSIYTSYRYLLFTLKSRVAFHFVPGEQAFLLQKKDIVLDDQKDFVLQEYFDILCNSDISYRYQFEENYLFIYLKGKKFAYPYQIKEPKIETVEKTIYKEVVKEVSPSTTSTDGDASSNFNAYNGLLGSGALKELADSSYFTSNLVQSSITNADDLTSKKDAGNMTIADLNTNSLLSNTLGNSFSALDSNDYTSALINSYKNNSASNALFDFTV